MHYYFLWCIYLFINLGISTSTYKKLIQSECSQLDYIDNGKEVLIFAKIKPSQRECIYCYFKDTKIKEYKQKTITIDISKVSDNTVSERWAAYIWKSSNTSDYKWIDIKNNTFTVPVEYDQLIICRMDGKTTENNWDNRWNQSKDLAVSAGSTFTATGWGTGNLINGDLN